MKDNFAKLWEYKIKILICTAAVLLINIVHNTAVLLPAVLVIFALLTVMKLQNKVRLKSILSVIFLAFFFSLVQALSVGSNAVYELNFAGLRICIFNEGVQRGILTFLRITGSMGTIFIMMGSMKYASLISALKWMRVPEAFLEVLVIAIKYVFIFKDEIFTIRKAQRARLGYGSMAKSVQSVGNIGGIVLSRAFDRSGNLAKSMKSRGYNGSNIINHEG